MLLEAEKIRLINDPSVNEEDLESRLLAYAERIQTELKKEVEETANRLLQDLTNRLTK